MKRLHHYSMVCCRSSMQTLRREPRTLAVREISSAQRKKKKKAESPAAGGEPQKNQGDKSTTAATTASNRQRFKQIPVHPTILSNIRSLGLGIDDRKSGKRRDETDYLQERNKTIQSTQPPAPFGRQVYPIRIVGHVEPPKAKDEEQQFSYDDYRWPRNINSVPEVALVGRSNVGKSTLLNALLYTYGPKQERDTDGKNTHNRYGEVKNPDRRRRQVTSTFALPKGVKASMSPRPGETKALTFYQLHGQYKKLRIVDLPGYGFAYASPTTIRRNLDMMTTYLLQRPQLRRMLLLLDARHGVKQGDVEFLHHLEENSPGKNFPIGLQLVLTKCDCVKQADLARRVTQVQQQVSDCFRREPTMHPTMFTAARELQGLVVLQKDLARFAMTVEKDETTSDTTDSQKSD